MFENANSLGSFGRAELEYRSTRIRDGLVGRRRGRPGVPRVRRPSGPSENAR